MIWQRLTRWHASALVFPRRDREFVKPMLLRKTMEVQSCPIGGLKIVQLKVLGDSRGFFVERFNAARFGQAGLPTEFVQDNQSRSAPNILRGLHYQHSPAQGKLVGVIRGRAWDVVVDIRPNSPTFGQYHAAELTGENGLLFWIPAGFAHGFCTLGDEPTDMLYKVTAPYNGQGEGGIRFDDPALAIPWPVNVPAISERDRNLPSWREYCTNPPRWESA
jgi:dTDP-4-dehydrorhamnose 3,5-epimerase